MLQQGQGLKRRNKWFTLQRDCLRELLEWGVLRGGQPRDRKDDNRGAVKGISGA